MMMSSPSLHFASLSPFRGFRRPSSESKSSPSPIILSLSNASHLRRQFARVSQRKGTSESEVSSVASLRLPIASEVVRDFYDGINRRDLESVEALISDGCVYEDLIFSKPFVSRKAIMEFFKKFTESISSELQFVIDDISSEDTLAAGVTWHLEWRGRPFPFSKGCSFYRLDVSEGTRKIIFLWRSMVWLAQLNLPETACYARDSVEPAFKPGAAALAIISAVTWLLQRFPQLADRL